MSLSLDAPSEKAAWINAINTDKVTWPQVLSNDATASYSVGPIPQNFLIGPDGKVIAKDIWSIDLENKLNTLLN